jgi:hypothetical protein
MYDATQCTIPTHDILSVCTMPLNVQFQHTIYCQYVQCHSLYNSNTRYNVSMYGATHCTIPTHDLLSVCTVPLTVQFQHTLYCQYVRCHSLYNSNRPILSVCTVPLFVQFQQTIYCQDVQCHSLYNSITSYPVSMYGVTHCTIPTHDILSVCTVPLTVQFQNNLYCQYVRCHSLYNSTRQLVLPFTLRPAPIPQMSLCTHCWLYNCSEHSTMLLPASSGLYLPVCKTHRLRYADNLSTRILQFVWRWVTGLRTEDGLSTAGKCMGCFSSRSHHFQNCLPLHNQFTLCRNSFSPEIKQPGNVSHN